MNFYSNTMTLAPIDQKRRAALNERLNGLFAELAAKTANWPTNCASCGRCCNFCSAGVVLFASSVEVLWVLDHVVPVVHEPDVCPFQFDKRCAARPWRPLGCRVYFCSFGENSPYYDIYQLYLRRIKDVAAEFEIEWEYGPFLDMLPHYVSLSRR